MNILVIVYTVMLKCLILSYYESVREKDWLIFQDIIFYYEIVVYTILCLLAPSSSG